MLFCACKRFIPYWYINQAKPAKLDIYLKHYTNTVSILVTVNRSFLLHFRSETIFLRGSSSQSSSAGSSIWLPSHYSDCSHTGPLVSFTLFTNGDRSTMFGCRQCLSDIPMPSWRWSRVIVTTQRASSTMFVVAFGQSSTADSNRLVPWVQEEDQCIRHCTLTRAEGHKQFIELA